MKAFIVTRTSSKQIGVLAESREAALALVNKRGLFDDTHYEPDGPDWSYEAPDDDQDGEYFWSEEAATWLDRAETKAKVSNET